MHTEKRDSTTIRRALRYVIVAILILGVYTGTATAPVQNTFDSRIVKLTTFFQSYECPEPLYVEEYLRAADAHALDYRILPALSVRESTCGRHERLNNLWGWASAKIGFASVPHGIEFIIGRLAKGRPYRGKTVDEKLFVYNPNPQYVHEVKELMREIDD